MPDVISRLSRDRVLVTEYVEGIGFNEIKQLDAETRSRFGEIVFRFYLGSIFQLLHFNADAHPGNYLLLDDGRVAFLDFGMTKRLDVEQIELEIEVVKARVDNDPERLREKLHDLGFIKNPQRIDAERLMEHVNAVGGWYLEDEEKQITSRARDERDHGDLRPALRFLHADAPRERPRERADGPADGDRRARGARPAAREAATGTGSPASGGSTTSPRRSSASRTGGSGRSAAAPGRDGERPPSKRGR